MNALFKLAVLTGPVAVAGCAATSAPVPPPPADHPASPQAAAAAVPERSNTLALEAGGTPAAHEHATSAEAAPTSNAVVMYTCPHHPEVTQATPGTCPKCKMKLQPAEQTTPAEPADAKGTPDPSAHESHNGHGGHGK
jgi:Cu+-exporting ATPase